ncbi:CvfB family protein [Thalassotalea fusca]
MANIGKYNTLSVIALSANGAYLDGGSLGEILLPNKYVPTDCDIDDKIEVFIYADSADRLVATTERPKAQVGEFASLRVKDTNKMGAFLDWGLAKDLLVPFNQQHKKMEVGRHYLVYVYVDERTERLVASSKLDKFVDIWPADYKNGQEVTLTIAARTDLGFKAIIDHHHWGLLYANEIFKPVRIGQSLKGYVKRMREDGRVDLSLTRVGKGKVIDFKDTLIEYLNNNDGFTPLNDKSSPELIQKTLGVSKKTFKATVGNLLKQNKITITSDGIKLVN